MKKLSVITSVTVPMYLAVLAFACSSTGGNPPGNNSGGSVSSGGAVNKGGAPSSGGAQTGGAPGSGGAQNGGAPGSGGAQNGGAPGSGGASSNAGAPTSGGSLGSGGKSNTLGGSTSSGGTPSSGGSSSGGAKTSGGTPGSGGSGGASTGTGGSGGGSASCGSATAKPCPPTGNNSVAYIGCSMANNIGNGYKAVNGKVMWNSDNYGTGAQCVPQWVEGGSAWPGFDNKLKAIGGKDVVKAIMIQICIIQPATDAQVKSMIKAARAKLNPDTHIYLVGQPQYENGHHCDIAGGQEATTEEQAKRLGDDKSVDSNMSYLGTFLLNCDNGECADSCHANSKGEQRLGNQAKAFFGG